LQQRKTRTITEPNVIAPEFGDVTGDTASNGDAAVTAIEDESADEFVAAENMATVLAAAGTLIAPSARTATTDVGLTELCADIIADMLPIAETFESDIDVTTDTVSDAIADENADESELTAEDIDDATADVLVSVDDVIHDVIIDAIITENAMRSTAATTTASREDHFADDDVSELNEKNHGGLIVVKFFFVFSVFCFSCKPWLEADEKSSYFCLRACVFALFFLCVFFF